MAEEVENEALYRERVERAKSGKLDLDLSNLNLEKELPSGNHELKTHEFMTTPRAVNDEPITVRGAPKHQTPQLFVLRPQQLGHGRFLFAWRPTGDMLATASMLEGKLCIQIWDREGNLKRAQPIGNGRALWLQWDCTGDTLGVLQDGVGIFLWEMKDNEPDPLAPMHLCPNITISSTFCKWSKVSSQLAIGTNQGKVIIFNKQEGVMQLHEKKGKHGVPITCGDWLFDNRLGLASGARVKISQPIGETGAKWESFSKFRLGGIMSKVPRHIKAAGDPTRLSFTLGYPPFVAVSIGEKYLLTFDTTRVHEDLGLTFPEDYGGIANFKWLHNNTLLVGLTNGYIVTVDFGALVKLQQAQKLPERVSAMSTTRVFSEYLTGLETSGDDQNIAICGDQHIKILKRVGTNLEVQSEIALTFEGAPREPQIGEFLNDVQWTGDGKMISVGSTDGWLYTYGVN